MAQYELIKHILLVILLEYGNLSEASVHWIYLLVWPLNIKSYQSKKLGILQ